jgi:hypothetical protein
MGRGGRKNGASKGREGLEPGRGTVSTRSCPVCLGHIFRSVYTYKPMFLMHTTQIYGDAQLSYDLSMKPFGMMEPTDAMRAAAVGRGVDANKSKRGGRR